MLDNSTRKEIIIDQIKAIGNLKIILRFEPDSLPTLEICKEKRVEL